jgi:lipopolysaccharide/colanic/teichoic acid biosynthesis glycosyltransferase
MTKGDQLRHQEPFEKIGDASQLIVPAYPKWKRIVDIVLALVGLLISLPVLLLAAIAIRLSSAGPIFFSQWRTGEFGKPFKIIKLRTMVVDAEELKAKLHEMNERDGPAFKMKYDPRVTRVGRFLRATGIDELPQLVNVLKGDMSIVGPRPLPCSEAANCTAWQRRRLDTKPGITCFWQIMKSRVEAFDDWMRLDLQYLAKRSFFQDVRLIAKTVLAVIFGRVGH